MSKRVNVLKLSSKFWHHWMKTEGAISVNEKVNRFMPKGHYISFLCEQIIAHSQINFSILSKV